MDNDDEEEETESHTVPIIELKTPFQQMSSNRPTRHGRIDPRYKEFIEKIRLKPEDVIPTNGYKLRERISRRAYGHTPVLATHLVHLAKELKAIVSENINPPPPIFVHIPKAPPIFVHIDPATLYDALTGPDKEEWWIGYITEMERLGIRNTWTELS